MGSPPSLRARSSGYFVLKAPPGEIRTRRDRIEAEKEEERKEERKRERRIFVAHSSLNRRLLRICIVAAPRFFREPRASYSVRVDFPSPYFYLLHPSPLRFSVRRRRDVLEVDQIFTRRGQIPSDNSAD